MSLKGLISLGCLKRVLRSEVKLRFSVPSLGSQKLNRPNCVFDVFLS